MGRSKADKDRKDEDTKRRQEVAKLHWHGYTRQQIIDKTGVLPKVLTADLKAIERSLSPKTERTLKYLQNSAVTRLRPIQVLVWEIIEREKQSDNIKISAGRLFKDVEELVSKVLGISGERLTVSPDKALEALMREVRQLDAKAKGDGHKKPEEAEATKEKLPDFLGTES